MMPERGFKQITSDAPASWWMKVCDIGPAATMTNVALDTIDHQCAERGDLITASRGELLDAVCTRS
jgi:hypothetical protein